MGTAIEGYHALAEDVRDRIAVVNERTIKLEGRMDGHDAVCAQRHSQVIKDLADIRGSIATISKSGLLIAAVLLGIEIGRIGIPEVIELLSKAAH